MLRGGRTPNYDTVSVRLCEKALRKAGVRENVVIDCNHGNSAKDHTLQPLIFRDCLHQVREGNRSIIGLMLESFLEPGRQSIPEDLDRLAYGVSVTDGCIGWNETEELIRDAREYVREALLHR